MRVRARGQRDLRLADRPEVTPPFFASVGKRTPPTAPARGPARLAPGAPDRSGLGYTSRSRAAFMDSLPNVATPLIRSGLAGPPIAHRRPRVDTHAKPMGASPTREPGQARPGRDCCTQPAVGLPTYDRRTISTSIAPPPAPGGCLSLNPAEGVVLQPLKAHSGKRAKPNKRRAARQNIPRHKSSPRQHGPYQPGSPVYP